VPDFSGDFYQVVHFPTDLSDAASLEQALDALLAWLSEHHLEGELMLVNNSGFGSFGLFSEADAERDARMVEVNVKAPVILTAKLWPLLKKFGGMVVNVASTAAYQPTPYFITYGASKAFLAHWSLGLWRENLGSSIHVLTVCPGPTSTAFFHHAGLREKPDGGRGMTVERVVALMLKAIARRQPLVLTGGLNRFIAQWVSLFPKSWATHMAYHAIRSRKLP
jgi:short-subunit dehydrogenase